jgi:hypothetical protein
MPVTTVVLVIVLAAAVAPRREPTGGRRHVAFAAWVVAGFLGAFATVSFAVGLLVLPFAIAAIIGAAALATRAEILGLLPGSGAMVLVVAALTVADGRAAGSWFATGFAFVAAGVVAYTFARRHVRVRRLS